MILGNFRSMADALHADISTVKRTSSTEHRSTHHAAQEINIESERSGKLIDGCRITIEGLIEKFSSGNTTKKKPIHRSGTKEMLHNFVG